MTTEDRRNQAVAHGAPHRTNWTKWAEHAEDLVCEGCDTKFRPNHPRRRFCGGPGCPGRRPSPPRRRRSSARAQQAVRAAGVAGFLGDVLVEANRFPTDPTHEAMGHALVAFARAERAGNLAAARAAAVQMCAMGAARAVLLIPPSPE